MVGAHGHRDGVGSAGERRRLARQEGEDGGVDDLEHVHGVNVTHGDGCNVGAVRRSRNHDALGGLRHHGVLEVELQNDELAHLDLHAPLDSHDDLVAHVDIGNAGELQHGRLEDARVGNRLSGRRNHLVVARLHLVRLGRERHVPRLHKVTLDDKVKELQVVAVGSLSRDVDIRVHRGVPDDDVVQHRPLVAKVGDGAHLVNLGHENIAWHGGELRPP
mmetsp:Transcript_6057/g.14594  ORF Transcript_6057/g.14594 Transcript_6057/m.14594 type:complete len:218 (+) Transcript_6057:6858-7511(+)